jgi:hypothetical protein
VVLEGLGVGVEDGLGLKARRTSDSGDPVAPHDGTFQRPDVHRVERRQRPYGTPTDPEALYLVHRPRLRESTPSSGLFPNYNGTLIPSRLLRTVPSYREQHPGLSVLRGTLHDKTHSFRMSGPRRHPTGNHTSLLVTPPLLLWGRGPGPGKILHMNQVLLRPLAPRPDPP